MKTRDAMYRDGGEQIVAAIVREVIARPKKVSVP